MVAVLNPDTPVLNEANAIILPGMLQIGDQFDRYLIRAHIARGGMSDIYRAYDLVSRREVALKIPDPASIGDPAQYERFQRELEVFRTLNHPAILRGLGSGEYNRTPYLATELISGQSLRALLTASSPLPLEQAVALIRPIADGVAFCHEHGIIHRDLKPENVLITPEGQPVIMDFGLALTKGAHRITYANLSATAGTPEYMAPEQVEGQRGDRRTDLYALGIIFYEMLAGAPPLTGDNPMATMAAHLTSGVPRLDRRQPSVSPQIAAVVARCLQRNPEARYPDLRAFIEALDHPETADLSLLDQADEALATRQPWWRSALARVLGLSLLVILALVALGWAAQALR
jgi:serine/threonine-protein kinase